uniref:Uncharacterized protein n=1 Tax=Phenylobacterium glaciei TaxID=2803784 RepID=A0A974P2W1_9CAUL|nr:hypothetical protein JKL49_20480 [Phenylobacterium glaciei]
MRIRVATQMRAGWAKVSGLPGRSRCSCRPGTTSIPSCRRCCRTAAISVGQPGPRPRRWRRRPGGHPCRPAALARGARFRGEGRILERLRELLAERRQAGLWAAPVGLLTHHLDHDEAAWRFLDRFIAWTQASGDIAWRALPDLLAELPVEISPVARKG